MLLLIFFFFKDTYKFKYVLSELSKKSSSKNQPEKSKWDEYQEALRDLKTSWISKFGNFLLT